MNHILLLSFLFLPLIQTVGFALPFHGNFNPALSFSGPFDDERVPGWALVDSSVVTKSSIRLTPDTTSRKGGIWSTLPNTMSAWEIEVEFKVGDGTGIITGADGLAIWYTDKPEQTGDVFGSEEFFSGIGIILDSFDNNNDGSNPLIMAVQNDGTESFDHSGDGKRNSLDSCTIDYRTLGSSQSARIRIHYDEHRNLRVWVDLDPLNDAWSTCLHVPNLSLPKGYFFGVTAATGGISDEHQVFRFESYSLNPRDFLPSIIPGQKSKPTGPVFAEHESGVLETIKKWFSDDEEKKPERKFKPGRPFRTMDDILTKVEEEEMRVKKNRLQHMSESERSSEMERDQRWSELQSELNSFRENSRLPKKKKDDAENMSFTRADHRVLSYLQETLALQSKLLLEIAEQVNSLSTRDEMQALHALILSSSSATTDQYDKRLSAMHENIQDNMNSLHNRFQNSFDLNEQTRDQQDQILKGISRNRLELSESIKNDSSGSFWFLFIVFQLVFAGAMVSWKMYRAEIDKKFW